MEEDHGPDAPSSGNATHSGPPDLILQAIVPPTDAPAEIRAAVADALARWEDGERVHTWAEVGFAASAVALVEGTSRRDIPDTQWVFALSAERPVLGQQVRGGGGWSCAIVRTAPGTSGGGWRASVFESLSTAPRAGGDLTATDRPASA